MDQEKISAQTTEELLQLRVAVARLQGQLDKTPGRFEFFAVIFAVLGIMSATFFGVFFFIVQNNQKALKDDVIEIIEEREAEIVRGFKSLGLDDFKISPEILK